MAKWLDPDNTGKKQVAGKWNGNWKPLQIVKELRASIVPNDPKKVKLEWDAVPNQDVYKRQHCSQPEETVAYSVG